MDTELIKGKLKKLQGERQKGINVINETQAQVLRIEGAILQLQELLNPDGERKKQKTEEILHQ